MRRAPARPGRWRVAIALFVVISCVATSISAFGVFLPVLSEAFGWSRGAVSVALSLNLFVGGVAAFWVGSLADRHGPRGVLAGTVLIGAVGFALAAAVRELWQLYLVYGLLIGVGASSIYVVSAATVTRWFEARRGVALAVVLSGFNLGWLVGGPVAAWLIERVGWRGAYLALGGVICGVGGPASLWVRYPGPGGEAGGIGAGPARPGAGLAAALRDGRFWCLQVAWFCLGLVLMTVTVHSVPFARDLGLTLERASFALTAYGVGAAAGRFLSGFAADRYGARATMGVCMTVQAVALVALVAGPPAGAVALVLVVFGLGVAGADTAFVKVIPEVFGVAALAGVIGVLGLGWRSGAALGPAAAGFIYDATRSYTIPFGAALLMLGAGGIVFTLGTRTPRGRPPGRS